jgi:hypothetical protein
MLLQVGLGCANNIVKKQMKLAWLRQHGRGG